MGSKSEFDKSRGLNQRDASFQAMFRTWTIQGLEHWTRREGIGGALQWSITSGYLEAMVEHRVDGVDNMRR
eukprot:1478337-Pyramimonas_sp.AAC.1